MTVTREQVMVALLTKLSAAGEFKTVTRRNRNPETIGATDTPALMLLEHTENYRVASTHQPAIRRLMVKAIVYFDVGSDDNAIPSSVINSILDQLDAILAPDNVQTRTCTLGSLVQSIVIDGTIIKSPGDITGKGLAIVPLNILLP